MMRDRFHLRTDQFFDDAHNVNVERYFLISIDWIASFEQNKSLVSNCQFELRQLNENHEKSTGID